MTRSLIDVESIDFRYEKNRPILQDLSMSFAHGVHALTGPSGCGKSTVLYLAGLMLRPRTGRVRLLGTELHRASDAERARWRARHIGFVFQDALLEPSMSVEQCINEGLPSSTPTRATRARRDSLAEELGVHDLMHQRASRLSGGQAQRVAVVRALLKEPTIVLADEPTGNLDDVSASAVLGALYSHAAAEGRVCLVVTHDQRVADSAGHVHRLPGAHSTTAAPE